MRQHVLNGHCIAIALALTVIAQPSLADDSTGRIRFVHDGWVGVPDYWKLVDAESGKEKLRGKELEEQAVPPGTYRFVVREGEDDSEEVTMAGPIRVTPGAEIEVSLRTGIRLSVPDSTEEPLYWFLRDPETRDTVAQFRTLAPRLVPAGQWDLIWRQEEGAYETVLGRLTVEPDKMNDIPVRTAVQPDVADWIEDEGIFWGLIDERGLFMARFSDIKNPQLVAPGDYRIVYGRTDGSAPSDLGPIEVEPDVLNEPPIKTGVKLLLGAKPPVRVEYSLLDGDGAPRKTIVQTAHWGEPTPLPPGTYRVTYQADRNWNSKSTVAEKLEVPEGSLVEIKL